MKKAISILTCILVAASGLFAGPYMMSYQGTYAIPMDSPAYRMLSDNPIWLNNGRMEGSDPHDPSTSYGSAIPHDAYIDYMLGTHKNNAIGNYSDYNMISIGGYKGVKLTDPLNSKKAYNSIMLRMTVESPAGLNFVSLSHPNITRPYGVGAVPVFKSNKGADSLPPDNMKMAIFKNSGDTFDFVFNNVTSLDSGNTLFEIWYDMVLILPGEWDGKSRTLADSKNKINIAGAAYELVPADDYSSVVNIRMELFGGYNGAGFVPVAPAQVLSIPISGYYKEGAASRNENTSFGMHIMPNNNCANLNINQQQGKLIKIADINLLSKNIDESGPNIFPKEPLYNGKVPEKPGEEPVKAPATTKSGIICTIRPEVSYKGYYVTNYNSGKYDWPRYDTRVTNSLYNTPILPGDPKPNRDNYPYTSGGDSRYDSDMAYWRGMNVQPYSAEYQGFLDTQKAWDDRLNDPREKAWMEQTDAWNKHQQWEKDIVAWPSKSGNDMFVFFSSNQDPLAPNPEPFMLVHESKPGDTPLNSRNHIKFTLVSYDKQDKSTRSFDGTTYFDPMGDTSQFEKFIQTHDFSIKGGNVDFHGQSQNNRKYEGEIYLVMENKPDQIMIRGKYTEKIYVHVISSR